MLPGPNLYFECPNCKNISTKDSLLSGNTFGAIIYSDGKRIAPMLPEFPYLIKCQHCSSFYYLSQVNEVKKSDIRVGKKIYNAKFLNTNEYLEALGSLTEISTSQERYIRFQIYWNYNDRVRNNKALFNSPEEEVIYIGNINQLIKLLDDKSIDDQLSKAEMYRNTGLFEKSIAVLNKIETKEYKVVIEAIRKQALNENRETFKLFQ